MSRDIQTWEERSARALERIADALEGISNMKLWWEGIRAWWLRRFRGFVAAPALHRGRGTSWQEHKRYDVGFTCRCGEVLAFMDSDLVIRERDHVDGCAGTLYGASSGPGTNAHLVVQACDCPITDARYVKICPACHLGHWKNATPQLVDDPYAGKREPA